MGEARMTLERFEALVEAWGGMVERWPEAERAAARALLAREPVAAAAVLARAEELDAALDAWAVPAPSPALRAAVFDARARPVRAPVWPPVWGGLRRGWGVWLSGAGLAAATLAGVMCGAALDGPLSPEAHGAALVAAASPDVAGPLADLAEDDQT